MQSQGQLEPNAKSGRGCLLGLGSGCLVVPLACILLVVLIAAVINLSLSSATSASSGFSAIANKDIPPDYLQLYQSAAATCPGMPAPLIAAVGKIESNHGRSTLPGVHQPANPDHLLGPSSGTDDRALANFAGAAGPMQIGIGGAATRNFQGGNSWGQPWDGTWQGAIHPAPPSGGAVATYGYGVDGDVDGTANVYNPADAIFTGTRMLCANWNKRQSDLWKAVFAYNHGGGATPDRRDDYVTKVGDYYNQYLELTPVVAGVEAAGSVNGALGERIVAYARMWLGTPYQWAGGNYQGPTVGTNSRGDGAKGFDCSGLTMYAVYKATGGRVKLLHNVKLQFNQSVIHRVPYSQLQPGDLIALHGWGHVGIYIGGGKMIHAPSTGDVVKISDITHGWYRDTFITGGRVVP
jgi:cell wall-associated NlpC family hydrolase